MPPLPSLPVPVRQSRCPSLPRAPRKGFIAHAQVDLFLSHRDFYRLDDRWHHDVQRIRSRYLDVLVETLQRAQDEGSPAHGADVDLLAPALFGVISHVTLHLLLAGKPDADRAKRAVHLCYTDGVLSETERSHPQACG